MTLSYVIDLGHEHADQLVLIAIWGIQVSPLKERSLMPELAVAEILP